VDQQQPLAARAGGDLGGLVRRGVDVGVSDAVAREPCLVGDQPAALRKSLTRMSCCSSGTGWMGSCETADSTASVVVS
jgi:hypothetical protein